VKKNTKLLLGAGAALGLGYLLLRKDDGKVAGLGAAGDALSSDEQAEVAKFDSFYYFESGFKGEYGDILARIAAMRGATLTEAQQDAAYNAAVLAGMLPKGTNTAGAADKKAALIGYYGPFLLASLAALGLAGAGESISGECPAGTEQTGLNADGSPVCTAAASGADTGGSPASTYHTRDLGDPCSRSSDCVGALLCRSKKCVAPKAAPSGSAPSGSSVPTTKDPAAGDIAAKFTGDTQAKDAEAPAVAEGGMGLSSWLLVAGGAAAVWFLLRTDDTKVTRLREVGAGKAREYGAAAKKRLAAEYEKRFARGSGVNGLRRTRKAKR
jgi:hypothetical protein